MARDTNKLKKLIFDTLNDDVALRNLLGSTGRVRHGNPNQLSEYPLVTYNILADIDNPYNTDRPCDIVDSRVIIQSFTTGTSTEAVSDINDRVYALLNGQQLSDANVSVKSSYRQSAEPLFDPTVEVWSITASYSLVNITL